MPQSVAFLPSKLLCFSADLLACGLHPIIRFCDVAIKAITHQLKVKTEIGGCRCSFPRDTVVDFTFGIPICLCPAV